MRRDFLKHGARIQTVSGATMAQSDLVEEKYRGMSLAQIIRMENAAKRKKTERAERKRRLAEKAAKLTAYNEERRRRGEI
jgi:hypothetical protein